jgi:hypothetical protein
MTTMRSLIVLFVAVFTATAQINMSKVYCPGGDPAKPKVAAYIPVTVTLGNITQTISLPTCLDIGANLKVNGSTLEAVVPTIPPPVVIPKLQMEKISLLTLNPTSDPAVTKASFNLLKTPIADGVILAVLRSSVLGGDLVDITHQSTAVPSKTLDITMPTYRPYLATDVITVVYYSLE